jgi:dolichol kinase
LNLSRETRRQMLHLGMASWVVVLRWLTPSEAAAVAAGAIVLNWIVMPVLGLDRRVLRREGESFIDGVKLYPVAVLVALLIFPYPAAAAAWAVMGVGDAASNLVGRRFGKPPFLGRDDRSFAGTAAFVATAMPAALLAGWWVVPQGAAPPLSTLIAAAAAAAVAGAAMEFIRWPKPLEDNLPITLAAGAAFAALM